MAKQLPPPEFKDRPIPFLEGRPERDMPIGKDDLLNLRIALALLGDVEAFCRDRHLFELQR